MGWVGVAMVGDIPSPRSCWRSLPGPSWPSNHDRSFRSLPVWISHTVRRTLAEPHRPPGPAVPWLAVVSRGWDGEGSLDRCESINQDWRGGPFAGPSAKIPEQRFPPRMPTVVWLMRGQFADLRPVPDFHLDRVSIDTPWAEAIGRRFSQGTRPKPVAPPLVLGQLLEFGHLPPRITEGRKCPVVRRIVVDAHLPSLEWSRAGAPGRFKPGLPCDSTKSERHIPPKRMFHQDADKRFWGRDFQPCNLELLPDELAGHP
jgi:hypothetical protein